MYVQGIMCVQSCNSDFMTCMYVQGMILYYNYIYLRIHVHMVFWTIGDVVQYVYQM